MTDGLKANLPFAPAATLQVQGRLSKQKPSQDSRDAQASLNDTLADTMATALLDVAHEVLAEAGQPLRLDELTRRILDAGKWSSASKTPAASIEAALAVDVKRKGGASRFIRVAPRTYSVNAMSLSGSDDAGRQLGLRLRRAKIGSSKPRGLGSMTFLDAAAKVLEDEATRQPMHYRLLTQRARTMGLLSSSGATPEATMYAQILTDIDRRRQRGEEPRFTKHGKGLVGLAAWNPSGLAAQIDQSNKAVRRKLLAYIKSRPDTEFELLVGTLLGKLGFEAVEVTRRTGDGGIDVRGTLVIGDTIRIEMAVQAKRWKGNVQAPDVQRVRGAVRVHQQGLIITTSDFSPGAREEAKSMGTAPVALMNGDQLVKLLTQHGVMVRRVPQELLELDLEQDAADGEG
jgi:restriction system protein